MTVNYSPHLAINLPISSVDEYFARALFSEDNDDSNGRWIVLFSEDQSRRRPKPMTARLDMKDLQPLKRHAMHRLALLRSISRKRNGRVPKSEEDRVWKYGNRVEDSLMDRREDVRAGKRERQRQTDKDTEKEHGRKED